MDGMVHPPVPQGNLGAQDPIQELHLALVEETKSGNVLLRNEVPFHGWTGSIHP